MMQSNTNPITLALDVGGSGVKGRCFRQPDEPVTERVRIKTPRPAKPEAVIATIIKLLEKQRPFDRVSIGFPGVVIEGVTQNAPNLDGQWKGIDLRHRIEQVAKAPVRVVNDADMHGYGAIEGRGVEMMITLGTGMGAALFSDGRLLPNLELGHHPFEKGFTYEERLGQAALDKVGKETWNHRAQRAFALLQRVFNYRVLYVGGGNVRKLTGKQPDTIVLVPNAIAFSGGVKLWDAR
ncbi:MAG TPA: ROK family protein [Polyangiaceae bacterium]|nr:MAG: Polyphosphate glucokinase [Deltaproteobacteria bacterium ADurb.Bin207]HNS99314.1 ROK family protein [Polyangiaceae bacterium]HNZ21994.1 ROK family protein [Polyangiaceae bacterium]HOD25430.1 ROK family protein [Polyangiaceae bacterium]HOE47302.1 ROK family protein [Polyangiaceae bacterium]